MHKHQCGDDGWNEYKGPNPDKGCGHIFEHGEESAGKAAAHMCPKCGKGPWALKLPNDETVRKITDAKRE